MAFFCRMSEYIIRKRCRVFISCCTDITLYRIWTYYIIRFHALMFVLRRPTQAFFFSVFKLVDVLFVGDVSKRQKPKTVILFFLCLFTERNLACVRLYTQVCGKIPFFCAIEWDVCLFQIWQCHLYQSYSSICRFFSTERWGCVVLLTPDAWVCCKCDVLTHAGTR